MKAKKTELGIEVMENNNQIDNTSYYALPCGAFLEDYIHACMLDFAAGSAVKYLYRAGRKSGESHDKDVAKAVHYVKFIAKNELAKAKRYQKFSAEDEKSYLDKKEVEIYDNIAALVRGAVMWDGKTSLR